jgi:hypothetical protein
MGPFFCVIANPKKKRPRKIPIGEALGSANNETKMLLDERKAA